MENYTDYHCRHCGEVNLVEQKELDKLKQENQQLKERVAFLLEIVKSQREWLWLNKQDWDKIDAM